MECLRCRGSGFLVHITFTFFPCHQTIHSPCTYNRHISKCILHKKQNLLIIYVHMLLMWQDAFPISIAASPCISAVSSILSNFSCFYLLCILTTMILQILTVLCLVQLDVTFPSLACSIISLDAMDISGEQHLDVVWYFSSFFCLECLYIKFLLCVLVTIFWHHL